MTKQELIQRLNQENIPPLSYSLDDGLPNDKYCLGETYNGWEVYYSERGIKYDVKTFSSEEEACDYLYECLKKMMKYL